jgi:heme oxygenase
MSTLKELTWENHKKAERTKFMQRLIKRNITSHQYYVYLKNQAEAYRILEYYASFQGTFDFENEDLYPILRTASMLQDVNDMQDTHSFEDAPIFETVKKYQEYIKHIKDDKDKLLAHIYVRHMGDLSGGQIIKKLIPGPTRTYEFGNNPEELKNAVRKRLHDGLVDEANTCFIMVQEFLEELEQYFDNNLG